MRAMAGRPISSLNNMDRTQQGGGILFIFLMLYFDRSERLKPKSAENSTHRPDKVSSGSEF
jgi:hypothetical protein